MIRTESDLQECRRLWAALSPQREAWDDWDLMFAFHDPDNLELHFLVHETADGRPDGLVPLVRDSRRQRFMLMGGSYPDGRVLWLEYEDFPAFFEQFPERTVLFDLGQGWVDGLLRMHPQFETFFGEQDLRYYLVPSDFGFDLYRHIDTFPPDKKRRFLYDLRYIGKRNPVPRWSDDDEADLFIELVNRNFGGESDYASQENASELRRVINELQRSGRLKTLTIEIDGRKEAVSLSVHHGNKMIALYASGNSAYNNLGKLLNFETIQEGCRLRVDEVSCMTGMQWKADWKMQSEACITLRKPAAPWPDPPWIA